MRIVWRLSDSERKAAWSLGAAGLCALTMVFCGMAHRFGTSVTQTVAALGMLPFTFGWIAYLATFWRRMRAPQVVETVEDERLAA